MQSTTNKEKPTKLFVSIRVHSWVNCHKRLSINGARMEIENNEFEGLT